jgi:hypothetical protein
LELSGRAGLRLEGESRKRFVDGVTAAIAEHGGMRIGKDAGVIVGVRAGGP